MTFVREQFCYFKLQRLKPHTFLFILLDSSGISLLNLKLVYILAIYTLQFHYSLYDREQNLICLGPRKVPNLHIYICDQFADELK